MFSVGIITASDKGSKGEREDISGMVIKEMIEKEGYQVQKYKILPDDRETLSNAMINMADDNNVNLILTTGGTGFSMRDWTPEATKDIIHREAPGIAEGMRYHSLQFTPRAMLSRGVAGIRDKTLIINLPGSPKAVKENLEFVLPSLKHGLEILLGKASECGQQQK